MMDTCTCHLSSIHEPHDPIPSLVDLGWDLFYLAEKSGRIGYHGGGWWFLDGVRIRGQMEVIDALLRS